jgi:phosphohistidine phosphatase
MPGMRDFDRPLDQRGEAEARDVAGQALISGLRPERIISSPAQRCRQTTQAMTDVFSGVPLKFDEDLYGQGVEAYMARIDANRDCASLLIVGHNPMIEELAQRLSMHSPVTATLALGYPTAGFLTLAFERPLPADLTGCGNPLSLFIPSLTDFD